MTFTIVVVLDNVEYVFLVEANPMKFPRGGLTVEIHDDPPDAADAGWETIACATGAPIFYRAGYLTAYHDESLGDIDRFAYLTVHDPGVDQPVAVVPIGLHRTADPIGGLRLAHPGIETGPALLSHVWHCYDTRIVGAVERADVVTAVLATLADRAATWGARWYGFVNVERGSATSVALTAAGLPGTHLVDRFVTDLTGVDDLDGYLARLGTRARANLTRNARRAREAGLVTSTVSPDEADLAEVAELCARTATRFGNTGFYPTDRFARFVATLGPLAHILRVRQRGKLVAVGVCLTDETRLHTWTCGVDYDVTGNASPYAVLFAASVSLALRLGRPILEGGRGNEVFKRRHGLTARHLDAHVVRV